MMHFVTARRAAHVGANARIPGRRCPTASCVGCMLQKASVRGERIMSRNAVAALVI